MAARKKTARKKTARTKGARTKAASKKGTRKKPARRQPENLRLRSAVPSFTVNDIDASVAWYRDVLGCVVEETWNQDGRVVSAMIRSGVVRFFLSQDDWKKGHDRKKGEGVRIFTTTAQDVDRLAALIKSRGGRLTHDPQDQPWGVRDFGVIDPDGFKITIASAS